VSTSPRDQPDRAGKSLDLESDENPQLHFPITGGTLATNYTTGQVTSTGGVEIIKKGKTLSPTMKIANVWVEFAQKTATVELEITPVPPFPGATGRSSIVEIVFPANAIQSKPDHAPGHDQRRGSETAGGRRADAQHGVQPGRRKSAPGEQRIRRG